MAFLLFTTPYVKRIMSVIGTNIAEAKKWLEAGQVVGIPTETVYGLVGNALNQQAVTRI